MDLNEAKKAIEEFLSILEKDRLLIWRTSKVETISVPPPKFLILEVTNRCNLNCIHCSVCANEGKRSELTTKEWTTVIADAASMGTQALGLSGGEPLLRKDIFEIAAQGTSRGLQVGLVTNGLLLNSERIAKIKHLGLSVQVSLDGSKPWIHDKIRDSPGCFKKLMSKLELLKKEEVNLTIATVATKQNYYDLPELLNLSESLGASAFRVQPFFPVGRGSRYKNDLDLDSKDTKEISMFLKEACKHTKMQTSGFYFQFLLDQEEVSDAVAGQDAACSGGYDFAGITPEGFVYPCSHVWQLGSDNVRDQPFPWIWQNSRLLNFFRSIKKADINSFCSECRFFTKCLGGCRAMNLINVRIFDPDSHCWLANKVSDLSPQIEARNNC